VSFVVDKMALERVVPCHYHSTNGPYLSSSTYKSYQKDKRAMPSGLPKRNAVSEAGENRTAKYSIVQQSTASYSKVQHRTTKYSIVQQSTASYSKVQHRTAKCFRLVFRE
jgi:hypothetical protein